MEKIKFSNYHLSLDGSYTGLRDNIKKLLSEISKKSIDDEILNSQIDILLECVSKYDPNRQIRRYRLDHRKGVEDFIPKMKNLLNAIANGTDEDSPIVLKLNLGTLIKPQIKPFTLPVSPRGNKHLLEKLQTFLLEYYEDNPPFKFYKGLAKLSLEYMNNYPIDNYNSNDNLVYDFQYTIHLQILNRIRKFLQFNGKRRENSILTEKEGRFLLYFFELIDYSYWKKSGFESIRFQQVDYFDFNGRIAEIKHLRDEFKRYLKYIEESNSRRKM